jgi:predicted MFS family arabinose efflux permease
MAVHHSIERRAADTRLHVGAIVALATSSFVFVTAETLPVGLLPQIAHGLSVSEADVGLLLTSYAAVAAVATIPLTAWTMRLPRHRLLAALVAVFAVSQAAAALAPTFAILIVTRLLCALAHGVFWSAITPAAARLGPPGQAGRITSLVFVGNSIALVLGVPLMTALGQAAGWRAAFATLAVAGALSCTALLKLLPVLPAHPKDRGARPAQHLRAATAVIRSPAITAVCAVTTVVVIGHFAAYTYIAPLVRHGGGLAGLGLSALLLGYGAAGLVGNILVGPFVDRHPGRVLSAAVALVAVALATLSVLHGAPATVVAVLAWGLGFSAVPVSLQSVVLRVAPEAQDAASAVYVVAFQIGIGGGALIGDRFVAAGHLGTLPVLGAVVAAAAVVIVLSARSVFPFRPAPAEHAPAEAFACAP